MYVVLMMAIAEALSPQGTVLGAFLTLVLYGVLPLSVLLYILGTPLRRRRSARLAAQADAAGEPFPASTPLPPDRPPRS